MPEVNVSVVGEVATPGGGADPFWGSQPLFLWGGGECAQTQPGRWAVGGRLLLKVVVPVGPLLPQTGFHSMRVGLLFLFVGGLLGVLQAAEPSGPTAGMAPPAQPRLAWGPIKLEADDVPAFPETPQGWCDVRADQPQGKVEALEYDSAVVGTRRRLKVYTPPGYTTGQKYPVLYLLHGIGGDESEWLQVAKLPVLLDNLIADGKAKPLVVVMPNGRAQKDDRPVGDVFQHAPAFAVFERDLLDSVIPAVEAHYSVRTEREQRALAGLSMGGGQALNFGLGHLETFGWVGAFSSAPNTRRNEDLVPSPSTVRSLRLLWLSCGKRDGLLHISQEVHAFLKAYSIPHVWHVTDHGHDADEWRQALYWFVQALKFQP